MRLCGVVTFFSIRVHFWLNANPFDLPRALNYFVRVLDFLPTLFISFVLGWAGHVLMDWGENVKVKKTRSEYMAKNTHKTIADNLDDSDDDDDDFIRGDGEERDASDDTDIVTAEQAVAVQSTRGGGACNHDQPNMISFDSTSGRPDFEELMGRMTPTDRYLFVWTRSDDQELQKGGWDGLSSGRRTVAKVHHEE
mmetsp:Transcript_36955/g.41718  ORF Transcript_36955/g.41718 Transcript_36955/m.41718 type:complete len:195 (-) Transcript_36955:44-628(-)